MYISRMVGVRNPLLRIALRTVSGAIGKLIPNCGTHWRAEVRVIIHADARVQRHPSRERLLHVQVDRHIVQRLVGQLFVSVGIVVPARPPLRW